MAFRKSLGTNDMLAYLSMMAPRLVELQRVLKSRGILFLHCDPSAIHSLKLLRNAVFGPECFLSEIVWKCTSALSSAKRQGPVHDVILLGIRSESHSLLAQSGKEKGAAEATPQIPGSNSVGRSYPYRQAQYSAKHLAIMSS